MGRQCDETRRTLVQVRADAGGGADRIAHNFTVCVEHAGTPLLHQVLDVALGISVIPLAALAAL